MNQRNVIIILSVVLVLVIVLLGYNMISQNKKATAPIIENQEQIATPCADTINLQNDLKQKIADINYAEMDLRKMIAGKNQLQKALNAAIKRCRPNSATGDTIYVKVVEPDASAGKSSRNNYNKPSQTPTQTSKSSANEGQTVSSEYRAPEPKSVSTSVTGGNTAKALFCINVRDMDGSSFWPALAIDAGVSIEGAVLNGDKTGWNISIYPVDAVSGLYGVTKDGRMFVKAELLDPYGPTVIKMSGSPNGWKFWAEAQLETHNGEDYYITP